ncbi:Hypothetical predicted protein [Octopus vulgaris]|uniref:Uncharacterized protein n=1 Tax=Octopus vulgaris TaxID=6645 RepID=A0AA36B986_OCTVU|nr:Hypothetical predicted protein [Octopus vulgaris]
MAMKRTGCSLLQASPPPHEKISLAAPNRPFRALKGKENIRMERAGKQNVPNENENEGVTFDVFEDFPPLPSTSVPVVEKDGGKTVAKKINKDGVIFDVKKDVLSLPSISATVPEKEEKKIKSSHTDTTTSNNTTSHHSNFVSICESKLGGSKSYNK